MRGSLSAEESRLLCKCTKTQRVFPSGGDWIATAFASDWNAASGSNGHTYLELLRSTDYSHRLGIRPFHLPHVSTLGPLFFLLPSVRRLVGYDRRVCTGTCETWAENYRNMTVSDSRPVVSTVTTRPKSSSTPSQEYPMASQRYRRTRRDPPTDAKTGVGQAGRSTY